MTLDQVKALSNLDLLELYTDMVRIDHYDPFETPEEITELRKNGIRADTLEALILERMQ